MLTRDALLLLLLLLLLLPSLLLLLLRSPLRKISGLVARRLVA